MVTAEQVKQLLNAHGWTLILEPRRSRGKRFAIAKKRHAGRMLTRYIKAESKFDELTEEDVLRRIQVSKCNS
jgi:hypothetical protein